MSIGTSGRLGKVMKRSTLGSGDQRSMSYEPHEVEDRFETKRLCLLTEDILY